MHSSYPEPIETQSYLAEKRQNLNLAMERLEKPGSEGPVSHLPVLLHLEITSRCNLRCLKCGHATDPPGTARIQPRHLSYALIETLDRYFAAAVRVHTFGYGEMFLYGKLRRLVERLKHHECIVDGITNGVLVGKPEIDWLVDYGYDDLTFSIDGVEAETMQRLRGVDVEAIWNALAYLKERKQECGKDRPRAIVNFVAQADNYHELPALVRKLAPLGIAYLGVNPLMPSYNDPETDAYSKLYKEFGLENAPREKVEAAIEEARRLADEARIGFGVFIDIDALWGQRYARPSEQLLQIVPADRLEKVHQENRLQPYYCAQPWTSLYVHADAGARVCCFQDGSLGTISSAEDLHGVWTGNEIRDIRQAISEGNVHRSCQSCVSLGRYQQSYPELDECRRMLETLESATAQAALPQAAAD